MNRMMIANELLKVAKLLTGFWDMKIVPPTAWDVKEAKRVVMDCLQKNYGVKCDKVEFERFMSFHENKECNGPNCTRDSNKHLCVFGFVDKDGTYSGGVAGGRIGENNVPVLYAPFKCSGDKFGVAGKGEEGERKLKQWIDGYIRKKTTQKDAYKEVNL